MKFLYGKRMEETHKKNNGKNIVILILCLTILVLSSLFVFWRPVMDVLAHWNNSDYNKDYDSESSEVAMADAMTEAVESPGGYPIADAATGCDGAVFYGDTGYLVKGALLRAAAKAGYDNLPDTLALIHYGDQLEPVGKGNNILFKPLRAYDENHPLKTYLQLVAQEDVELLRLLPNRQRELEVVDVCDFHSRYGDYFDPDVSVERETPIAIKKALIAYLRTQEGAGFDLVKDRRNKEQVYRLSRFCGSGETAQKRKRDLAVILTKTNDEGRVQERMLVLGYDERTDEGKIIFNEAFYSGKLLIQVYGAATDLPEEARSLAKFVSPSRQLVGVKRSDGDTMYLYYDDEFDAMKRQVFPKYGDETRDE